MRSALRTCVSPRFLLALALVAPALVVARAAPVAAQSDAEFNCQQTCGKASGKDMAAGLKCAIKCQQRLAQGLNPASDCYTPYGGAMTTCLDAAGAKVSTTVAKACDPGTHPGSVCPPCYDAAEGGAGCGVPGYASDRQMLLQNEVDVYVVVFFCKTAGASAAERLCQQNAAKVGGKFMKSIYKCFGRCYAAAHAGTVAPADCAPNPIVPNDATTTACLKAAQLKADAAIDKKCSVVGVNIQCPPECYVDAACDSAPNSGDGVCTQHNCTAGNTTTTPYSSGSEFGNLIMNQVAEDIVDSGLGPNTGVFCQ